jgi:hypothetical protein
MSEQLRLATLEWGESGPTVLLIHGLTSMARSWWRSGAKLSRAGHMVRNSWSRLLAQNNLPVVVFDEVFRSEGIYSDLTVR